MIKYRVFCRMKGKEQTGEYLSWGIRAEYADGTAVDRIEDISTRREVVEAMAEVLNKGSVEVIHLRDIVDDMLSGQKSTLLGENVGI